MNAHEIWLKHVEDVVYCKTPATRFTQKRSFLHPAIRGDYRFYPMPSGVHLNLDEITYIFEIGEIMGMTKVKWLSINWETIGDLLTDLIPVEIARDMVRVYTL